MEAKVDTVWSLRIPKPYIDPIDRAARSITEILGPFDLDPCAKSEPLPWPTANLHYTKHGLQRNWCGFDWLNPPESSDTLIWLMRLAIHGNGIALNHARTDYKLFQKLAKKSSMMLFPKGVIKFCCHDGTVNSRWSHPNVFVAYGETGKERLLASGLPGIYTPVCAHAERWRFPVRLGN